ncbi:hypothetical protein NVP1054O_19 [Vibrio phage 1.054.O._10N.261.52.A1]|nr:hypothetical protein NVP1054O_19 [Vibrio phage 1.054.O._10N.261.52.A1]
MSYVDGKWVTDKFKPRRYTQDRMSNKKLVEVRKHREFLEKADDLVAAVFGDFQGNLRTKHNRTLACK